VLAFAALLTVGGANAEEPARDSSANFDAYVPGAAALEGRIIAPCCWTQTIDIHGSEISTELRQEIRSRLRAGESSEAIEQSLVERYGPKILAVPPGSRLGGAGAVLGLGLVSAGAFAVVLLKRWQRRSKPTTPTDKAAKPPATPADTALDARVDAELARLDGE
jgi:cytochrome c-type biogenesis protein CcmH